MSDKSEASGVSSVVGIILMVAVTVTLVVLASNFVFNIGETGQTDTADATVELKQSGNQVEASIIRESNVAQVRIVGPNGDTKTITETGESVSLQDGNGLYTAISVTERGSEQVVLTTDTTTGALIPNTDAGGGQVVNGVVEVNPPIPGATVEAINTTTGNLVATDTTDQNGEYSVSVSNVEDTNITVNVDGFTFEGRELHATARAPADVTGMSIDFDETKRTNTSINGSDVSVIYTTNADGDKLVGNLRQLQAMNSNLGANYVLIRDIDATDTAQFNGFTENIIKDDFVNEGDILDFGFDGIQSISVTNASGTDVTDEYEITQTDNGTIRKVSGPESQDITATATYNNQKFSGFAPIGPDTDPFDFGYQGQEFSGSFDGQGHTIDGLFIDRPINASVGLFGRTDSNVVKNVRLTNVTVTGSNYVGGLVGQNGGFDTGGTVSNASATGDVTGEFNSGGLVGRNLGTMENASASASVTGGSDMGGLVGDNTGTVSSSSASGTVTANSNAGGLVGRNTGTVSSSSASGTVTSTGDFSPAGGLIGRNSGIVKDSSASGSVTGDRGVGGLVGINDFGTVENASASGSVTGTEDVGGLVGTNDFGTVENASASGSVTGNGFGAVGGLVGFNYGDSNVSNVSASGDVTGSDSSVGGLVGQNQATVSNAFASGTVTSPSDVGGLVGANFDTVENSYWLDTTDNDDATDEIGDNGDVSGVETGAASGSDFTLDQARGETASDTGVMDDLDFQNTWQTVTGEFPQLRALND